MKNLILATAAALVLSAPMAFAASAGTPGMAGAKAARPVSTQTMMQRCNALEARFDKVGAAHQNAANYQEAKALETEGKNLCTAYHPAAGVKYVRSALKIVEAKPANRS